VNTLGDTFKDLWRSLREPPDEVLLELGAEGEVVLARFRLLLSAFLILLPTINFYSGGNAYESMIGFTGVGLAVLLSQAWLTLARRRRRYRWLSYVSASFDVSVVSMLLILLAFREPSAGLNSVVVWCFYPLVVLATALRNDVRVTLLAGVLAVLQFSLVSSWFLANSEGPIASVAYGTVYLSTQLQRVVILLASTLVTTLVVARMQRLVQLSGTDGLTGLPNRTFLNLRLPQIIAEARGEGDTICLALIDLDHFKRINDELGHQAGDRALRHIVETLRLELRREEPLLRVGGEEFVLVLRQPLGAAWERMDSLRRTLERSPFDPGFDAEPRRVTLSAGMACCPTDAVDVSGLMRSADLRLRAAKRSGRNRVVVRDSE
jgi:two-component system cell cycle response regulator